MALENGLIPASEEAVADLLTLMHDRVSRSSESTSVTKGSLPTFSKRRCLLGRVYL